MNQISGEALHQWQIDFLGGIFESRRVGEHEKPDLAALRMRYKPLPDPGILQGFVNGIEDSSDVDPTALVFWRKAVEPLAVNKLDLVIARADRDPPARTV